MTQVGGGAIICILHLIFTPEMHSVFKDQVEHPQPRELRVPPGPAGGGRGPEERGQQVGPQQQGTVDFKRSSIHII